SIDDLFAEYFGAAYIGCREASDNRLAGIEHRNPHLLGIGGIGDQIGGLLLFLGRELFGEGILVTFGSRPRHSEALERCGNSDALLLRRGCSVFGRGLAGAFVLLPAFGIQLLPICGMSARKSEASQKD